MAELPPDFWPMCADIYDLRGDTFVLCSICIPICPLAQGQWNQSRAKFPALWPRQHVPCACSPTLLQNSRPQPRKLNQASAYQLFPSKFKYGAHFGLCVGYFKGWFLLHWGRRLRPVITSVSNSPQCDPCTWHGALPVFVPLLRMASLWIHRHMQLCCLAECVYTKRILCYIYAEYVFSCKYDVQSKRQLF